MSFQILNSTASRPIFLQLIAQPINMGSIYPILYQIRLVFLFVILDFCSIDV